MGTQNAFYVRGSQNDGVTVAAIRQIFNSVLVDAETEFVRVVLSPTNYVAPEWQLAELSSRLHTDVIWLGFQSVVDAFQFHHWWNGVHLRALVYGCFFEERTWERAEGAPECWERDVFFTREGLISALAYADASERTELERIWREGEISQGYTEPSVNARECARKVAAFYNLPL